MSTQPRTPGAVSAWSSVAWRPLLRHYAAMVLAMLAGMLVVGGLRDVVGLSVAFDERPATDFLLMATDMAIGMAVWMRWRGRHGWAGTVEMCAAMYVPVVLLPFVWSDAMADMMFMVVAHTLMFVAMLAVLVRRRNEFCH